MKRVLKFFCLPEGVQRMLTSSKGNKPAKRRQMQGVKEYGEVLCHSIVSITTKQKVLEESKA